jgi:predicted acetyltransferase
MDKIEIIPAGEAEKPVMENLMHLYLYEFTDYTQDDADDQGRFLDEHLPRYWVEPNRYPFLVKFNEKPAGFVLVRDVLNEQDGQVTHHIAEFFVMRKYRRKKIGQQMASRMFDAFPGRWNVEEMPENLPAQAFWRKVISIYTGGKYTEVDKPEWDGPVQEFNTVNHKEVER